MNKTGIVAGLLLVGLLSGCNGSTDSPSVRVKNIGDSFSLEYFPYVHAMYPESTHNGLCPYFQDDTTGNTDNAGSSARVAACMDMWLDGVSGQDVYFNAGMHDVYIKDCGSGHTSHQVGYSDYLMNLQTSLDKIRSHGDRPVFITTVPVEGTVVCHSNADIITYNAGAVAMMRSQGVEVVDMYTVVLPHLADFRLPDDIHFNDAGAKFMAQFLVLSLTWPSSP